MRYEGSLLGVEKAFGLSFGAGGISPVILDQVLVIDTNQLPSNSNATPVSILIYF